MSLSNDVHPFLRALGFLLIALGFVVLSRIAFAEEDNAPQPTPTQLALALDVARTAVNEASLGAGPRDVDLIYEATRYHGATDADRLAWLRLHSSCTNPAGDCNRDGRVNEDDDRAAARRPGNARWTRNLRWSSERPAGFSNAWRWRADRWERIRRRALVRVMRDRPTRVCGVPIRSWGRRSDFVARPGLVPVDCGARNLGATTPRHAARMVLSSDPR